LRLRIRLRLRLRLRFRIRLRLRLRLRLQLRLRLRLRLRLARGANGHHRLGLRVQAASVLGVRRQLWLWLQFAQENTQLYIRKICTGRSSNRVCAVVWVAGERSRG